MSSLSDLIKKMLPAKYRMWLVEIVKRKGGNAQNNKAHRFGIALSKWSTSGFRFPKGKRFRSEGH